MVRLLLQLPQYIKQEDGTRELFEQIFQEIDVDNSNDISLHEFENYFYKKRGWFRGSPQDWADEHGDSVTVAEQALAEAKAAELVALAQEVAEQCASDGGNAQNDAPRSESNNQKPDGEAWFQGHMTSVAADPAVALEVIRSAFNLIDKNNDSVLSRIEVIKALRGSVVVRLLLQLPQYIKQEDGTRELFEQMFQEIDIDNSNDISLHEFGNYFYKKRGWFCRSPQGVEEHTCTGCERVRTDGEADHEGDWFCAKCWEGGTDEEEDIHKSAQDSVEEHTCMGCECIKTDGEDGAVDTNGDWFCTKCSEIVPEQTNAVQLTPLEKAAAKQGVTIFLSSFGGHPHESIAGRVHGICNVVGMPLRVVDFVDSPELKRMV